MFWLKKTTFKHNNIKKVQLYFKLSFQNINTIFFFFNNFFPSLWIQTSKQINFVMRFKVDVTSLASSKWRISTTTQEDFWYYEWYTVVEVFVAWETLEKLKQIRKRKLRLMMQKIWFRKVFLYRKTSQIEHFRMVVSTHYFRLKYLSIFMGNILKLNGRFVKVFVWLGNEVDEENVKGNCVHEAYESLSKDLFSVFSRNQRRKSDRKNKGKPL